MGLTGCEGRYTRVQGEELCIAPSMVGCSSVIQAETLHSLEFKRFAKTLMFGFNCATQPAPSQPCTVLGRRQPLRLCLRVPELPLGAHVEYW